MSGSGVPQDGIATLPEINAKTLRKHFRRELDRGAPDGHVKARAGWREKHEFLLSAKAAVEMADEGLLEEFGRRRAMRSGDFGLWCEHALAPQGLAPAADPGAQTAAPGGRRRRAYRCRP